jgi:hypothetical protein
MTSFTQLAVAAGLAFCLAASPAFADIATSQADTSSSTSVLDAIASVHNLIAETSPASTGASQASAIASAGPSSSPTITLSSDLATGAVNSPAAGSGSASGTISLASYAASAEAPAAPADSLRASAAHLVGAAMVLSAPDLSGSLDFSGSSRVTADLVAPIDASPVPLPAAALLLGSGLLGLASLRRPACRFAL